MLHLSTQIIGWTSSIVPLFHKCPRIWRVTNFKSSILECPFLCSAAHTLIIHNIFGVRKKGQVAVPNMLYPCLACSCLRAANMIAEHSVRWFWASFWAQSCAQCFIVWRNTWMAPRPRCQISFLGGKVVSHHCESSWTAPQTVGLITSLIYQFQYYCRVHPCVAFVQASFSGLHFVDRRKVVHKCRNPFEEELVVYVFFQLAKLSQHSSKRCHLSKPVPEQDYETSKRECKDSC